jgi:hypothetical protein
MGAQVQKEALVQQDDLMQTPAVMVTDPERADEWRSVFGTATLAVHAADCRVND